MATTNNNLQKTETKEISARVKDILNELNSGLIGKEEVVRLAFLSVAAGESIFLLGPPGVAKSLIARRIKCAFTKQDETLKYFEYLMNQFSTPDEISGPVSLTALEENKYRRITTGYIPDADIAFLDEIWKSSPAIQNTLLTVINEKKFHNGNEIMSVPLQAVIAASNELPEKNAGLEALWDRFIFRVPVAPIKEEADFLQLILGNELSSDVKIENRISFEEIALWKKRINMITLSDKIQAIIIAIRKEIDIRNSAKNRAGDEILYVSDRRWKKIIRLLKTCAFLNGRESVDMVDLQLIEYCIWNNTEQIAEAKDIVRTCVRQYAFDLESQPIKFVCDDIKNQVTEFECKVTERFFVRKSGGAKEYTMKDGTKAYKILQPVTIMSYNNQKITPYYISDTFIISDSIHGYPEMCGAYYDKNKNKIGNDYACLFKGSTKINEADGVFSWDDYFRRTNFGEDCSHSLKIEMQDLKYEKKPAIWNDKEILKTTCDSCENEFTKISNKILARKKEIDIAKDSMLAPFADNLFASQEMTDIIFSEINKYEKELNDCNKKLKKICAIYKDS